MSINAIQNELLHLSVDERPRMIDVLWDSVTEPEFKAREAAWAAEAERRIDAFDAETLPARDAATVLVDLRS